MAKQLYHWRPEDDAVIRERYDSRTATITALAALLGKPRHQIKVRARILGVARPQQKGPWTNREISYLEANLSRRSVENIAEHLGRSVTAVAVRAKRLGVNKTTDGYTCQSLAIAFGIDDATVRRWIRRGLLKAGRRHTHYQYDSYYISQDAVRRFVCTYPLAFNLRKVDQLWFIDLLAGVNGQPIEEGRGRRQQEAAC